MSSILEALKKSEAQRAAAAAGRAPATVQDHRSAQPGRLLWVLLPLATVLGAAVLWRYELLPQFGSAGDDAAGAVAVTPSPDGERGKRSTPPPAADGEETAGPGDGGLLSEPVAKRQAARGNSGGVTAARPDPVSPRRDGRPAAPASADPAGDSDRSAAAVPDRGFAPATAPPAGPAATSAGTDRTDDASDGQADARSDDQVSDRVDDRVSGPVAPAIRLPSLAQLPALEREIGSVEMTMLVYSQDPGRRFALVNGQRMVEGEVLAGGIELKEIRRNECVFVARGQQFVVRSQ